MLIKMIQNEDILDKVEWGVSISGCTTNTENGYIIIKFNEKFLNGEKVQIFPFETWYDKSIVVHDWSSMQVLVDDGILVLNKYQN